MTQPYQVNRVAPYLQQQYGPPQGYSLPQQRTAAPANPAENQKLNGLIAASTQLNAKLGAVEQAMNQQAMMTQMLLMQAQMQQAQESHQRGFIGKLFGGIFNAIGPAVMGALAITAAATTMYATSGGDLLKFAQVHGKNLITGQFGALKTMYQMGRTQLVPGMRTTIANTLHYAAAFFAGLTGLNFIQGYSNPKPR